MEGKKIPGKIIPIHTTVEGKFYNYWLAFLKPVHKLTPNQMNVLACFLKRRHELSKDISNPDILDQVTMNSDSRKAIREELDMSTTHFQVVMSALKEKGIITNGKINKVLIPSIGEDLDSYKLTICFNFDGEQE